MYCFINLKPNRFNFIGTRGYIMTYKVQIGVKLGNLYDILNFCNYIGLLREIVDVTPESSSLSYQTLTPVSQ